MASRFPADMHTIIIPWTEGETWLTHEPTYEKWLEDRFTKVFHYKHLTYKLM